MTEKYFAVREEYVYRSDSNGTNNRGARTYLKLLSESLNTTREDFFIDTTQYWSTPERAEGFFRTSGTADILVDPVIFPRILTLFMGDPTSDLRTDANETSPPSYDHVWKMGHNELYTATGDLTASGNPSNCTGVKPFSAIIGQGIEKDRELLGCVIRGMTIEGVSREHVTCSLDILGSGDEQLTAADGTDNVANGYADYTMPYFTFINTTTATINATSNKLLSPGTIEAFRMTAERGINTDYYPLGSRYLGSVILDGMVNVSGSMDFTFDSEDEHERFLSDVNSYETGNQASFATVLTFRGPAIDLAPLTYYEYTITIPKTHYTASTVSLNARDRIVQKVDWRAIHSLADECVLKMSMRNITSGYTTLVP
jgi:hypothetical protein